LKRTKIMYAEELKYALRAAQAAGDLLRDGFHAGFPESLDKAADECIIRMVSPPFPAFGYNSGRFSGG
jgi:hypothetical protein